MSEVATASVVGSCGEPEKTQTSNSDIFFFFLGSPVSGGRLFVNREIYNQTLFLDRLWKIKASLANYIKRWWSLSDVFDIANRTPFVPD